MRPQLTHAQPHGDPRVPPPSPPPPMGPGTRTAYLALEEELTFQLKLAERVKATSISGTSTTTCGLCTKPRPLCTPTCRRRSRTSNMPPSSGPPLWNRHGDGSCEGHTGGKRQPLEEPNLQARRRAERRAAPKLQTVPWPEDRFLIKSQRPAPAQPHLRAEPSRTPGHGSFNKLHLHSLADSGSPPALTRRCLEAEPLGFQLCSPRDLRPGVEGRGEEDRHGQSQASEDGPALQRTRAVSLTRFPPAGATGTLTRGPGALLPATSSY